MRNSKQISKWPKVRKFLNDIHLWGGLISGIVVFVVCLTGTIYVYNTEIRESVLSEFYQVEKQGERKSPDELLARVKPDVEGKVVGIKIPFADDKTTFILYSKPSKDRERGGSGRGGHSHNHAHDKATTPKDSLTGTAANARSGERDADGHKHDSAASEVIAAPAKAGQEVAAKSQQPQAPQGRGGRGPRANQLAVNPYTGEVIGDPSDVKTKTAEFMQKMFGLHRWLLLNEIEEPIFEGVENRKLGSWITGTATLLFLLGVLTGIVIWFPVKMRGWKNGLKIRWSANWKRINHDLHNTLAFYSFIILFLMSVTGPFWSFEWYREGWQKTWGTYQDPKAPKEEKSKPVSTPIEGQNTLTVEETILAVNKILPYDGDITINFAKDSIGTITITKNKIGFFAPSAGDKLTLDQFSGEVLEKDIFREKPFNERAAASIKALHIGDIYGPFTKLLYFLASIVATSLPITGVMIWINKMKKKK